MENQREAPWLPHQLSGVYCTSGDHHSLRAIHYRLNKSGATESRENDLPVLLAAVRRVLQSKPIPPNDLQHRLAISGVLQSPAALPDCRGDDLMVSSQFLVIHRVIRNVYTDSRRYRLKKALRHHAQSTWCLAFTAADSQYEIDGHVFARLFFFCATDTRKHPPNVTDLTIRASTSVTRILRGELQRPSAESNSRQDDLKHKMRKTSTDTASTSILLEQHHTTSADIHTRGTPEQ